MDEIKIKGARENNLKNISISLPKNKVIVVTGLSGSGKSSLVYDTLYAEGQRRYLQSLSSNAHQYINQLDKPDVDQVTGLSPTLAIDQRQGYINPRDTVGTMTDIYDHLGILYARVGTAHCVQCGEKIKTYTLDTIIQAIKDLPKGTRYALLAPMIKDEKGDLKGVFSELQKRGFNRVRLDGKVQEIYDIKNVDKTKPHRLEIVVDRLIAGDENEDQLPSSMEMCLSIAKTTVIVLVFHQDGSVEEKGFRLSKACHDCDLDYAELEPRSFSFNTPYGACATCSGVGTILEFDPDKVIPDKNLSFNEGAITTINPKANWQKSIFQSLSKHYDFDLDTPFKDLPDDVYQVILYGSDAELEISYYTNAQKNKYEYSSAFKGVLNDLKRKYIESQSEDTKRWLETFMDKKVCPGCKGQRLKPGSLAVTIGQKNIMEVASLSVNQLITYINTLNLTGNQEIIAREALLGIKKRLAFLDEVGLGYLTLDRKSTTISGGEYQRIRLATQIGSALEGVTYILDEPTIGLHPRDNAKITKAITHLRDLGNTVIVVEHDDQTMREADFIVDIGPGAGIKGGEVLFTGTLEDIMYDKNSITGAYLAGTKKIGPGRAGRPLGPKKIHLAQARTNNLKSIDVTFPLNTLTVVTGVSGSGKSSLVLDTLYPAIRNALTHRKRYPVQCSNITGTGHIDSVIYVDQSPIGKSPRSNPATYLGFFDDIRRLFAALPASKMRGFKSGRFSFNKDGGRCEHCKGTGKVTVKMHFLPDVYITCDVCKGKRYNDETLSIKYDHKNIYEVLEMSVSEALVFFNKVPQVRRSLTLLEDIGLGYLKLGQSSTTLSGGESQRVKLADELSKNSKGHTLYLLDEPTTGLHFQDISNLMRILHHLVDGGNTVILIEHNLDVIKQADHIIDVGPGGGEQGGEVIFTGTPQEIMEARHSHTGAFLKKHGVDQYA